MLLRSVFIATSRPRAHFFCRFVTSEQISSIHHETLQKSANCLLETLGSIESTISISQSINQLVNVPLHDYLRHSTWKLPTKKDKKANPYPRLKSVLQRLCVLVPRFEVLDAYECFVLLSDFRAANPLPQPYVEDLKRTADAFFRLLSNRLAVLSESQSVTVLFHAGRLGLSGDITPFLCNLRSIDLNKLSINDLDKLHRGLSMFAPIPSARLTPLANFLSRPETCGKLTASVSTSITYSWSRLGIKDERLLKALGDHISQPHILNKLNTRNMLDIFRSYSEFKFPHANLMKSLAERFVRDKRLFELNYRGLRVLVWGLATLDMKDTELFCAVGDHIVASGIIKDFDTKNLALTVWAFGATRIQHQSLLWVIAEHVCSQSSTMSSKSLVSALDSQGVSLIALSFVKLRHHHERLFRYLGDKSLSSGCDLLPKMTPFQLANLAWAFAQHGEAPPRLLCAIAERVARPRELKGYTSGDVATVAWALAVGDIIHDGACAALLSALRSSHDLSVAQIRMTHDFLIHVTNHAAAMPCTAALLPSCRSLVRRCQPGLLDKWVKPNDFVIALERALTSMPYHFVTPQQLRDAGGYMVDALCEEKRVVVLKEDKKRFLLCQDGKWVPNGATLMRRRHLVWYGYKVITVPFFEWAPLGNVPSQQQYLTRLLSHVF